MGGKLQYYTLPKFTLQSTEEKRSWLATFNQVVKGGGGSRHTGKINVYLLQPGALWMSHHVGCRGIKLAGPERMERVGVGGWVVGVGGGDKEQLIHLINSVWLWDARTHTICSAESFRLVVMIKCSKQEGSAATLLFSSCGLWSAVVLLFTWITRTYGFSVHNVLNSSIRTFSVASGFQLSCIMPFRKHCEHRHCVNKQHWT